MTPERGQIAHISLAPADTSRWPVILPGGTGHYLLSFDDSRVVAGATREPGAGFDYRVTPAGLAEVLAEALALAPGLGAGTYLETRVGSGPSRPAAAGAGAGRRRAVPGRPAWARPGSPWALSRGRWSPGRRWASQCPST